MVSANGNGITYVEGHTDIHGASGTYEPTSKMVGQPSVVWPDSNKGGSTDGLSYSAFQHRLAEVQKAMHGILTMGNIEDDKERLLLNRWMLFHWRLWGANFANRKGRIWKEQEMIDWWKKQMGDEQPAGDVDAQVSDVLQRWSAGASLITEITIQKRLYGLKHVGKRRGEVSKAREGMEQARYDASKLGPVENQIFWCRVRQHQIAMENTLDSALLYPMVDYTDVKLKLAKGGNVMDHMDEMTYWFQRVADRVYNSLSDGEVLRDFFATVATGQWPYDRRAPAPEKKGPLGITGRRDQPEENDGVQQSNPYADYQRRGGRNRNNNDQGNRNRRNGRNNQQ